MIHQTLARARRRRAGHDEPWTAERPALLGDAAAIDRAFLLPIIGILDRAHAELPPFELAALLLAVRGTADCPGVIAWTGPLPIAVERRFSAVERLLRTVAQRAEDDQARIQERLRDYVEDVAARPRGAALAA